MELTLSDSYNSISTLLSANGYKISGFAEINYGVQFHISLQGRGGVIRIYYSKKKGINPDLSQIISFDFCQNVKELLETIGYCFTDNKTVEIKTELLDPPFPLIGTDESGKGDFFGPLVVAATYMTQENAEYFKVMGIKDSKMLKDHAVLELASIIQKRLKDQFCIVEISPKKYNDLYTKFKSEQQTLNSLLGWGHAKAIEELLLKVECNTVIVDKFGNDNFVKSKLQEQGKRLNVIQRHKAESNIAVAAASILARARFVTKLSKLSVQYDVELPKGAGENVNKSASNIVQKCGAEALLNLAKMHFKMKFLGTS
ncbi:MAG TPA: ribonuclease HIII [Stenomitos sp.]